MMLPNSSYTDDKRDFIEYVFLIIDFVSQKTVPAGCQKLGCSLSKIKSLLKFIKNIRTKCDFFKLMIKQFFIQIKDILF